MLIIPNIWGNRIRTVRHPIFGYQAENKHDIDCSTGLDWTGRGNHVTSVASGKCRGPFGGIAYDFRGSTQNSIPHSASHNNFTGSHTSMAWVRSRAAGQAFPMILCKGVVNTGYLLFLGSSEQILYRITISPDRVATSANNLILPGKWQHLCGCYDTADGYIRIYLDGIEVASQSVGSVTVDNNTNPLYIGGGGGSNYFNGDIGDISLFSRRLLAEEVLDYVDWCRSPRPRTSVFFGTSWLSGWTYRKSVTVSRPSGAVTNYPMKILVGESSGATGEDVDLGGNCNSDFSDLRFTNAGGDLLDYWIESVTGTTPNQLATVWVEFDSIGTSGTTFYMYYGNAGASDAASGANTFTVFDDFERGSDGDTIGGSWTETTAHVHISTDHAYGGTRCARWVGATGTNPSAKIAAAHSDNIAYRMRFWKEATAGGTLYWQHDDGSELIDVGLGVAGGIEIKYYDGSWFGTGDNLSNGAWNLVEVRNINWTAGTFDIYLNDVLALSGCTTFTYGASAVDEIVLTISAYVTGEDAYIDDLIVRHFRATEPAISGYGAEETESAGGTSVPIFKHHYAMLRAS